MQTTVRRQLRARRPAEASTAAGAGAAAATAEAIVADVRQCRICWSEEDADTGGQLLSPCRCSGSQQYVHQRCLLAWMQSVAARKGVPQSRRCDVCRAPYRGLPRELRLHESPQQYLHRQAGALLDSPVGTAASYYAAGGLVFSVALGLRGAWCRLAALRAIVRAAQEQPLQAARLIAPDVLLSIASEACLSGQWMMPVLSAARFSQGLLLRSAALWVQDQVRALLPQPLVPLGLAVCSLAQLAGNAMQYTHMALLLLFGGLARGFARGALLTVQAPIRVVGAAARAAWHGAVAAAGLLPLRRRQRRRQARKSSSDGGGGLQEDALPLGRAATPA